MEETKKVTKQVSKKEARRKRNMRNTVIMAVLCVALLGGATYAWFTVSNTAKISNLALTVGEASGLMIAPEITTDDGTGKPGDYVSELNLSDLSNATGKLMPATLAKLADADAYAILKPAYSGNTITAYETVNSSTEVMTDNQNSGDYYYYEKVFYLMTAGTKLNIQLTANSYVSDNTDPDNGAEYPACDAIRIAFFDGDTKELRAVYEPNCNTTWGEYRKDKVLDSDITVSEDDATVYAGDVIQQNKDKSFVKTGTDTNSETLFTLKQSKDNRIIMRVYFEGNDDECCNIISLNKILGNLQFTTAQ